MSRENYFFIPTLDQSLAEIAFWVGYYSLLLGNIRTFSMFKSSTRNHFQNAIVFPSDVCVHRHTESNITSIVALTCDSSVSRVLDFFCNCIAILVVVKCYTFAQTWYIAELWLTCIYKLHYVMAWFKNNLFLDHCTVFFSWGCV